MKHKVIKTINLFYFSITNREIKIKTNDIIVKPGEHIFLLRKNCIIITNELKYYICLYDKNIFVIMLPCYVPIENFLEKTR